MRAKLRIWVLSRLSPTGLWMFGSCNQHQIKLFVFVCNQTSCCRSEGSKAYGTVSGMHDLYFSTKVILLLFVAKKAESWLQYVVIYKEQTTARDSKDSYVMAMPGFISYLFFRMFSGKWRHLTYLLAFNSPFHFHFMAVLSGTFKYNMFWDLGSSPQLIIQMKFHQQSYLHYCQSHRFWVMCTEESRCLNGAWGEY